MPKFFSSITDGIDVPLEKVAYLRWMAKDFSNRTIDIAGSGDNMRVNLVETHGFIFNRYIRHETLSDHILYETVERIVGVPTVTPLVSSDFYKNLSRDDAAALMKILNDVVRRRNRVDQTRTALQSLNSVFSEPGSDNPQLLEERRNLQKRQQRLDDTFAELEQFITPTEGDKTTKEMTIARARRSDLWTADVNSFFEALMEQSNLPEDDDDKPTINSADADDDDDDDDAVITGGTTTASE
jgi:hypothetical protein